MAEDNGTDLGSEVITTESPVPKTEKKTRAPRRLKSAVEPAASTSEAVTPAASIDVAVPVRRGPGRKPKSSDAKPADTKNKSAVKVTRMKRTPKPVEQVAATSAEASVTARDEMDDLIQLEAENQRLRKLLGEKLRQENADLRKRLGQG